ncbi:hypothetical protein ASE74_12950 [Pedobacter sp. Leaf216]|uniref:DUF2683 family protein n=1 Tax=Pedobacter sp. Leaf216 TaxID=1735684 RepID=UPI0006FE811C|nr:DUF2683 family protein [Pedobacter sp. Leaf216]KQM78861.1 hypothetical protein ASE74_12950 [Pedobacter sp. Leaf216]RYX92151.1 MAG: hypothetical protein EON78_06520 [bacterium]
METLIMHPKNKVQLTALKAMAKALEINFETSEYNSDFVAKIQTSKKEIEAGKVTRVAKEDLKNFLGL